MSSDQAVASASRRSRSRSRSPMARQRQRQRSCHRSLSRSPLRTQPESSARRRRSRSKSPKDGRRPAVQVSFQADKKQQTWQLYVGIGALLYTNKEHQKTKAAMEMNETKRAAIQARMQELKDDLADLDVRTTALGSELQKYRANEKRLGNEIVAAIRAHGTLSSESIEQYESCVDSKKLEALVDEFSCGSKASSF